eukprot:scaffold279954_cov27-Tisochrysis_lutea.AAC.1
MTGAKVAILDSAREPVWKREIVAVSDQYRFSTKQPTGSVGRYVKLYHDDDKKASHVVVPQ